MAALSKAQFLDALFDSRRSLVQLCATVYNLPPSDPAELRALATQALPEYSEVVQEIMDRLKSGK